MKDIVVAIDGFSGCGKSTTARAVASLLHYTYIDSGAMYRAATLFFTQNHIDLRNLSQVQDAISRIHIDFRTDALGETSTFLNNKNVEKEIREMAVSSKVSQVSALPLVRRAMVDEQRRMGKNKKVVMDGRDIGTNVFPDAELKIFMTADMETRAKRRMAEMRLKGQQVSLQEVMVNLTNRDEMDTTREENPLVKAADAIVVDTTHLSFEEQINQVVNLAKELITEK